MPCSDDPVDLAAAQHRCGALTEMDRGVARAGHQPRAVISPLSSSQRRSSTKCAPPSALFAEPRRRRHAHRCGVGAVQTTPTPHRCEARPVGRACAWPSVEVTGGGRSSAACAGVSRRVGRPEGRVVRHSMGRWPRRRSGAHDEQRGGQTQRDRLLGADNAEQGADQGRDREYGSDRLAPRCQPAPLPVRSMVVVGLLWLSGGAVGAGGIWGSNPGRKAASGTVDTFWRPPPVTAKSRNPCCGHSPTLAFSVRASRRILRTQSRPPVNGGKA
jgi:hypothetical protein